MDAATTAVINEHVEKLKHIRVLVQRENIAELESYIAERDKIAKERNEKNHTYDVFQISLTTELECILESAAEYGKLMIVKWIRVLNLHNYLLHYIAFKNALRLAAREKHADVVAYLIEHVKGVQIQNEEDFHIVRFAAVNKHHEILNILIKQGTSDRHIFEKEFLLCSEFGQLDLVQYLTEVKLVNIHCHNEHALYMAILCGHLHIVKYLVEKGANFRMRTTSANFYPHSEMALGTACQQGHLDICKYLLDLGAVPDRHMDIRNSRVKDYFEYRACVGDKRMSTFLKNVSDLDTSKWDAVRELWFEWYHVEKCVKTLNSHFSSDVDSSTSFSLPYHNGMVMTVLQLIVMRQTEVYMANILKNDENLNNNIPHLKNFSSVAGWAAEMESHYLQHHVVMRLSEQKSNTQHRETIRPSDH